MNRSLTVLLLTALSSSPLSAAVMVDDFTAGTITLRRDVGQPRITELQSGLPTASVIAGSRSWTLQARDYFSAGATGGVTLDVDAISGVLNYTNDPGITAVNFEVRYGSIGAPLKVNLAEGGNDRLRFGFKWAAFERTDDRFFGFDVRVETEHDTLGTWGGYGSVRIPNQDSPFVVDVFFKDIQQNQPYELDFSRVVYIYFGSSNGLLPGEFVLDFVAAVPEPTACAGLGIGAIMTFVFGRMRWNPSRRCVEAGGRRTANRRPLLNSVAGLAD